MKVEVTDRLERRSSTVLEEIETIGFESAADPLRQPPNEPDRRHKIVLGDVEEGFGVRSRNDERVPVIERIGIQNGEYPLGFRHDDRR